LLPRWATISERSIGIDFIPTNRTKLSTNQPISHMAQAMLKQPDSFVKIFFDLEKIFAF